MEPENPLKNYAELRRVERLQSRRENFLTTLRNVCKEKQYSYQQITGADDLNEAQWIEFRFIPKKIMRISLIMNSINWWIVW